MIHVGKQVMAAAGQDQCTLRPYSDGCPSPLTPHHCVPDHSFEKPEGQGGGRYAGAITHGEGLCVCVTGEVKSTKKSKTGRGVARISQEDYADEKKWFADLAEHGQIHAKFDKAEADLGKAGDPKNSAEITDLESAAAKAISEVTGCDETDLKEQMRTYHRGKGLGAKTKLRADPYGKAKAPPYTQMGTNTTVGGPRR